MHPLTKFEYCPLCGSHHFTVNGEKSRKCENCGFEFFMNPAAATVAFILNSKGELLVEKRKREPAKGMYDLPGGFADMRETAEQGVRREVLEETGLTVNHVQYMPAQRIPLQWRRYSHPRPVFPLRGRRRHLPGARRC